MTAYTTIASPLGELLLVGDENALAALSMSGRRKATGGRRDAGPFAEVIRQVEAYFAGELTRVDTRSAPSGTEFPERVWRAPDVLPYRTTTTYGALAQQPGLPRDRSQALGAAIGANPLLLVRPCHRVIGADGSMRGYAGGVERKAWLLDHEGALQPALF